MKPLLLMLSFICIVSFLTAGINKHDGCATKATTDTIPKKTYEYIFKNQFSVRDFQASADTVDRFILPIIGKSLSVDQADAYRQLLTAQFQRIIKGMRVDSIEIKSLK